jgi:hypothetical protein
MQQIEIQYFFPLTEQAELDLDFSPSEAYAEKERALAAERWKSFITPCNTTIITGSNYNHITSSFILDLDNQIVLRSKKKPNILARWIYKLLGITWQQK